MSYYLGIDIGTTSAKAVAFSPTGAVMESRSFSYEMQHPQPDRSEQDANEILNAVIVGIQQVVQSLSPQLPSFISFSAAMHSLMAIDTKGNLILPCIIWADNRAATIADNLKSSADGGWIYQTTGVPIHSMSPLCKLLWLKEFEPEIFKDAFKFLGIKEYIFYRLFNELVIDTSVASATGLLNTKTLQWDEKVLNFAGITAAQLPGVVSVKQVFYYKGFHPHLTLPESIPFVIGASDGALSNLGTGATGSAMAVTIGTSGAARLVLTSPETDPLMRTFCYHLKDNWYIAGGATNNGAVVLQWLKDALLQTSETYDELFEQAQVIKPASNHLLFLPYLLGERAPLWNSDAKGVYFGVTIQHTKAHFIRAAMEGVVYCLYSIIKVLADKKEVTELHASGGFAKSFLWLQVLADVANLKVLVSGNVESGALGAVMLGAEALGIETGFKHEVLSVHLPDEARHHVYVKCFAKFERVYNLLKGEMAGKEKD